MGSGRGRTDDATRTKDFSRLGDEALYDINRTEKRAEVEKRVETTGDAQKFGARLLSGTIGAGVVVEVRKGNFLTRMLTAPDQELAADGSVIPPRWKNNEIMRTIVRGMLQQFDLGLSSLVAPGDNVEVVVPPQSGEQDLFQAGLHGILTKVLARRNEFRRVHPSGRAIQTLAANIDRVVVVSSAGEPEFRPGFVDRVLACAASSGLAAALVLNKADLGLKPDDAELLRVYESLGVPVIRVSARDPESTAEEFTRLKAMLAGGRSVLTGHSGVGKSSLMRVLDPNLDLEIVKTGEISTQTGKGKHTTTHARLFQLTFAPGVDCEVIDTPGVREFTPADSDRRNLWGWFPEIAKLQGQCAFPDCTHIVEKGCAVLAAVAAGKIHPRRHRSYVRIFETLPS